MTPATRNWNKIQTRCIAMTTRNTFQRTPPQNGESLTGFSHISEGPADIEGQQGD